MLDCSGGNIVSGTNLQIYNSNGTAAQQFYIYNIDGKYVLKPSGGSATAESVVVDVDAPTQNAHLYTYSTSSASIAAQRFAFAKAPAVISNCTASNVTYTGYDIQANISGYVGKVQISTWAEVNGIVDTVNSEVDVSNGVIKFHVNISEHGNCAGEYKSQIYAYNADGDVTTATLTITIPESFEIIEGSTTIFDGTYVIPTNTNNTVAQVMAEFKCIVSVYSSVDAQLNDNEICGTGCIVKHINSNGDVVNSAIVVINGDINGDGNTSTSDYISIKTHMTGTIQLDGAYAVAADTNGDTAITSSDFLQLEATLSGKTDLVTRQ